MQVICADEIRDGDVIVGRELLSDKGEPFVKPSKSPLVAKHIDICPGQWRTHVHISGGCYDGRQRLAIN